LDFRFPSEQNSLALARMPRKHVWSCRWCAYQTKEFVENTSKDFYMERALEHHIQVRHTCQYCGAVGMKGKGVKIHEEACKRKQELKVARQAMLLICLADKANKEDKETNPTPIATLTADVLQCVFKHI
jgi:hypothetical protein